MFFKNKRFQFTVLAMLMLFAAFSVLSAYVEVPKRPVREFATMTMAMNPEETESVRLKIPWGYLAPNLSYLSAEDQNSFYVKAKAMMLLMGLTGNASNKTPVKTSPHYTTAFSFDALYPTFEAKNENNIEQFVSKRNVVSKVIRATVYSSAKGKYWNNLKERILSSYNVSRNSIEGIIENSKSFKHYGFSMMELPSQYGLIRHGLPVNAVKRLRKDKLLEGFIPRDIWENRNSQGELLSYMECMRLDLGWACNHTMYVASMNSRVSISYHSSLLKDWQRIEQGIRQIFKKFIILGKEK